MIEVVEDIKDRLDVYLGSKLDISRSKASKLVKDGNVLVNGRTVNTSYKVKLGDKIEVADENDDITDIIPEDIPLDIVYEDDDMFNN